MAIYGCDSLQQQTSDNRLMKMDEGFKPHGTDKLLDLIEKHETSGMKLICSVRFFGNNEVYSGLEMAFVLTPDTLMDMDLHGIDLLHHPKVKFHSLSMDCIDTIENLEDYWPIRKKWVLNELSKPFTACP